MESLSGEDYHLLRLLWALGAAHPKSKWLSPVGPKRSTVEMDREPRNMRLVVFVLAVCSLFSQNVQAETERLKVVLIADKVIYTPGEPIMLTLRVMNDASKPVSLSFPTAQRFDLLMQNQQGREVWRWSAGRFFAQMLGKEILKPSGGELLYQATVEREFPQGVYAVQAIVPALGSHMSATISVTVQ